MGSERSLAVHILPHNATTVFSKNDTSLLFSSLTDNSVQNEPHGATTSVPSSDHDEDNSPGYTGKAIFFLFLWRYRYQLGAPVQYHCIMCKKYSYVLQCHSEGVDSFSTNSCFHSS